MAVIGYHAVDPAWHSSLSVRPDSFRRHLDWLEAHRRVVPLAEAVRHILPSGNLAGRHAALTFDDGFDSIHTHAWPELARRGLPATVFVVSATLVEPGHTVDWVDESDLAGFLPRTVDRDQLIELADAGLSVQAHTHRHQVLPDLSDAECERELRDCRATLEDILHRRVTMLAYPRGLHDDRVRQAARRAGFTHAFGDGLRPSLASPYAIDRTCVYGEDSFAVFRAKLMRGYLPVRTSPTFSVVKPAVARVRRAVAARG